MSRYLVVANETVGGDDLVEEVRNRAGQDASFHVIVPAHSENDGDGVESAAVSSGGPTAPGAFGDPNLSARPSEATATSGDEAPGDRKGRASGTERSRVLLEHVLSRLESVTDDVTGEVAQFDAIESARDALASSSYDELILATPAAGPSKLVGQDLPHRLEQAISVPVVTVHAERANPQAAE